MNNNIKVPANHTAYHVITASHLSRLPTYVLFVVLGFIVFTPTLHAQDRTTTSDKATYRRYDTQRYFHNYLNVYTGSGSTAFPGDIFSRKREVDRIVQDLAEEVELKPIRLQLVFHILFTEDKKEAESLIKDQINALNRDFNAINPPSRHPNDPLGRYISMATSPKIKFELADKKSLELDAGEGVAILTTSPSWQIYDDMKSPYKGGSAAISPDKYINIWVVDMPEHMASYASSPYQGDDLSGIVIDRHYFGISEKGDHGYVQGKTLTHLMGNYLGLSDLWNDYQRCADDGVADTPLHNAASIGCPDYQHITTCYRDTEVTAMTMNFMNNTDDACQFMFTEGQVRRMRAMILTTKPSLISP